MALRDYSFGFAQLHFSNLTDGVICGCEINVSQRQMIVSPGIFKFHDFIYIMTSPQTLEYEATEQTQILKIQFLKSVEEGTDYLQYEGNMILQQTMDLQENEIELCRFKLKKGSQLRNDYTDFSDIQTEFDTVNLAHATWAGIGSPGIASPILTQFATEALSFGLQSAWDITFCTQCLQRDPLHPHVIDAYLAVHEQPKVHDNLDLFLALGRILNKLSGSTTRLASASQDRKRRIILD